MPALECAGCTACCRGQLVVLVEEDGDQAQYETVPLEGAGDPTLRQLKNKVDGSCTYLTDQGCSIYDRRPAMCRSFDCRLLVRSALAGQLPIIGLGSVPADLMRAGLQRLPTLD